MAERRFEAHLSDVAREVFDNLPEPQREEVSTIIDLLEIDPEPDGLVKITVDLPPIGVRLFRHRNWWVMYHIGDPAAVVIDAIRPSWPRPDWVPAP